MKAIIIAAGSGGRLGPLTADTPKSLLPILGKPLIEYNFETLRKNGIDSISVVTGYKAHKFTYPDVTYYHNTDFANNNILHSLMTAQKELDDDIVISYSDIWYSDAVLKNLLDAQGDIIVSADTEWKERYVGRTQHPWSEAEKVVLRSDNTVHSIGKHLSGEEASGEFIGLFRLSKEGARHFRDAFHRISASLDLKDPFEQAKEWQKAYVTDFLQLLAREGTTIQAAKHQGQWLEMDTKQDYDTAGDIIGKYQ